MIDKFDTLGYDHLAYYFNFKFSKTQENMIKELQNPSRDIHVFNLIDK